MLRGGALLEAAGGGVASVSASASAARILLAASDDDDNVDLAAADNDGWLGSGASFYGLALERVDDKGGATMTTTATATAAVAAPVPFPRVSFTIRFSKLNHASLMSNVAFQRWGGREATSRWRGGGNRWLLFVVLCSV